MDAYHFSWQAVAVSDPVSVYCHTCEAQREAHLHLLIPVLGGVLAALALSAQLLQLGLALLQALPFALVFHLVFLQGGLRRRGGGQSEN